MFALSHIYTNMTLGLFTNIAPMGLLRTYFQMCPIIRWVMSSDTCWVFFIRLSLGRQRVLLIWFSLGTPHSALLITSRETEIPTTHPWHFHILTFSKNRVLLWSCLRFFSSSNLSILPNHVSSGSLLYILHGLSFLWLFRSIMFVLKILIPNLECMQDSFNWTISSCASHKVFAKTPIRIFIYFKQN